MNRVIKFRGKRIDTGEWITGSLIGYSETFGKACIFTRIEHGEGIGLPEGCSGLIEEFVEVIPESVGQFTGLKDKEGKEIYESDIIRTETDKPMLVGWNNRFASWCLDRDGWAFTHWFGESCEPENCEVIGNIYETPELLKP